MVARDLNSAFEAAGRAAYEEPAAGATPGSYADLILSLRPHINDDLVCLLVVDAWCDRADAAATATRRTRP